MWPPPPFPLTFEKRGLTKVCFDPPTFWDERDEKSAKWQISLKICAVIRMMQHVFGQDYLLKNAFIIPEIILFNLSST